MSVNNYSIKSPLSPYMLITSDSFPASCSMDCLVPSLLFFHCRSSPVLFIFAGALKTKGIAAHLFSPVTEHLLWHIFVSFTCKVAELLYRRGFFYVDIYTLRDPLLQVMLIKLSTANH